MESADPCFSSSSSCQLKMETRTEGDLQIKTQVRNSLLCAVDFNYKVESLKKKCNILEEELRVGDQEEPWELAGLCFEQAKLQSIKLEDVSRECENIVQRQSIAIDIYKKRIAELKER